MTRAGSWLLFVLMTVGAPTRAAPVPGSLDVRWNAGAEDCAAMPQPPLQLHVYEPQTFILRQSPCADYEANFLYLLVGENKALLIDTGAVANLKLMPLANTVLALLPGEGTSRLPLLVMHTHGHRDHRDGDPQFASLPGVEIVPAKLPENVVHLDLGGRVVDVIPAPGHTPDHVLFYDHRTAILFSGDFLFSGRLLIDDAAAWRDSAARAIDYLKTRPVTHILGGHIELDAMGRVFTTGSHYHPDEHVLELSLADLQALPAALESFNGFYARHDEFILSNPMHNLLALAAAAAVVLIFIVWGVRGLLRRRRRSAHP